MFSASDHCFYIKVCAPLGKICVRVLQSQSASVPAKATVFRRVKHFSGRQLHNQQTKGTNSARQTWDTASHLILSHLSLNGEGRWGTTDDFSTIFFHFPCSPLPPGTWRTQGLSIPWCCLSASSSVCLVFFPLSLCLASWFWPDLMNGGLDHTTAICVSLPWSGGLRVVRLPAVIVRHLGPDAGRW